MRQSIQKKGRRSYIFGNLIGLSLLEDQNQMNNQLESYTLVQSYSYERLDVFFKKSCLLKTAAYAQDRLRDEGWIVKFSLESYQLVALRKVKGLTYIHEARVSDGIVWVYFDDDSNEWVSVHHSLEPDDSWLGLYRGKSKDDAVNSAKEPFPE